MQGHADRLQFAPPPPPGMLRALGFAVFAHLLLMLALGWGVSWKRESVILTAEAELWSTVPQEAAPKAVEPPPAPAPAPVPAPPPPAPPPAKAAPEPEPREVDIAIEREKERKAEARRKQLALEREEKRAAEKELAAKKKAAAEKKLEAKRELEERRKQELAKAKAAEDRQKLKQAEEAKRMEAQRQANLERMKGMAGATGAPSATGTALRSSGPSDSYPGRIRARVKPNIVFSEEIAGNPSAEVEVRTSPDGTIVGQRITKSSGLRGWDEAVLKAVIKTEVLPRDVDGRVHSPLTIIFRPKD